MKRLVVLLVILIIILAAWSGVSVLLSKFPKISLPQEKQVVKVESEESVVINDVKSMGPSVVTIEETSQPQATTYTFGPFQIYGLPNNQTQNPQPSAIGSGFIVSSEGLVVTSKHVVADVGAKFDVVTSNNKKYIVKNIYRDPLNDIALLKIDPAENSGESLKAAALGDSSHLQVGQFVVAIGTALGEFRNTVTTGVISGLGRAITAGDNFQGFVENLNNVIQTDAAINPGNSGGPLVNSSGEVIGVNTAIAQNGQNIGFALPINIVKASIDNFNKTGQFNRPYLGVSYKMISKNVALLNSVAEGAYVQDVVTGSPADNAGIIQGDIITKFDGKSVNDQNELSQLIGTKKVGDSITLTIWRDNKTKDITLNLGQAPNQ